MWGLEWDVEWGLDWDIQWGRVGCIDVWSGL